MNGMGRSGEENESVARVLMKSMDAVLLPQLRKKELLIRQKDALLSDALDILSSQESLELHFGRDFVSTETRVPCSTVVEGERELCVLSSWLILVKDSLCVGLDLRNVSHRRVISDIRGMVIDGNSESQSLVLTSNGFNTPTLVEQIDPNNVASLVVRIRIPMTAGEKTLSVAVSWASRNADRDVEFPSCPFQTVLNNLVWTQRHYVLRSVQFHPDRQYPVIRGAGDFCGQKLTKEKLMAVRASQTSVELQGIERDALCSKLRATLPGALTQLCKNHLVITDHHLLDGTRIQFHPHGRIDIFAWERRTILLLLNMLNIPWPDPALPQNGEERKDFWMKESALKELRGAVGKLEARKGPGEDFTADVLGEVSRKLNETFILSSL